MTETCAMCGNTGLHPERTETRKVSRMKTQQVHIYECKCGFKFEKIGKKTIA